MSSRFYVWEVSHPTRFDVSGVVDYYVGCGLNAFTDDDLKRTDLTHRMVAVTATDKKDDALEGSDQIITNTNTKNILIHVNLKAGEYETYKCELRAFSEHSELNWMARFSQKIALFGETRGRSCHDAAKDLKNKMHEKGLIPKQYIMENRHRGDCHQVPKAARYVLEEHGDPAPTRPECIPDEEVEMMGNIQRLTSEGARIGMSFPVIVCCGVCEFLDGADSHIVYHQCWLAGCGCWGDRADEFDAGKLCWAAGPSLAHTLVKFCSEPCGHDWHWWCEHLVHHAQHALGC
mmetsp:Transcript_120290/g.340853  ORF Transcript_120290/g.340853 Transcript_120290/m.340853 type:complete len:290 (-) Transcript_120290:400-1269(-)